MEVDDTLCNTGEVLDVLHPHLLKELAQSFIVLDFLFPVKNRAAQLEEDLVV